MTRSARHPDDATLTAYAAGTLEHGLSLVIATHIAACPSCRARCDMADHIGGAMMEASTPAPVSSGLLRGIMAALTPASSADDRPSRIDDGPTWHNLPKPLADHLPSQVEDINWWAVGPGLRIASLTGLDADDGVRLIRIRPGKAVPHHGHGGHELTLVIQGAYCDDQGTFHAGDIADLDDDSEHQPMAIGDQDCICIIATDARLEFSGLAPRLLQPIIGI